MSGDKPRTIIFIPGYKGSELVECHSQRTVWLSTKELLLRRRSLQLHDGLPTAAPALNLCAAQILGKVPVLPFLYSINIYQHWLDELQAQLSHRDRLLVLAYDWRQNNMLAVRQLTELVEAESKQRTVMLVAHSMGGLIAAHFLRYGAQDLAHARENWQGAQQVQKVVFAGVPFRGTVPMFRRMQTGAKTAWNKSLLDARSTGSFDSAFQLLPFEPTQTVYRLDGTPIPEDLYLSSTWTQYRWGVFQYANIRSHSDAHETIQLKLDSAKQFHQLRLQSTHSSEHLSPQLRSKILNIIGDSHATLARIYWRPTPGLESGELLKTQDAFQIVDVAQRKYIRQPGDGNVTVASAQLPEAWSAVFQESAIRTDREHGNLFDDPQVQQAIFEFLAP
jgi:pimeloyl-ACP methyl ester carboxylesterase